VLLCHGSPRDEDEYLDGEEAAVAAFAEMRRRFPGARVCLHGHTHVPLAAEERGGRVRWPDPAAVDLDPAARYLLNPGAVGQPRDGNPGASFGILDLSRGTWRVVRVPYDVAGARAKITAARLPAALAGRLAEGR
jgi:diadenosine tetraphosphatase ApaH/serine/threonine PP2A family protein phosphatase